MKPLTTIILLFICIVLLGQKETTISINTDSTEQRHVLLDSLLKTYSECDIFVITKVEEKKVYIKRLCDLKGKSEPIRKEPEQMVEVGNYFTMLDEFKY